MEIPLWLAAIIISVAGIMTGKAIARNDDFIALADIDKELELLTMGMKPSPPPVPPPKPRGKPFRCGAAHCKNEIYFKEGPHWPFCSHECADWHSQLVDEALSESKLLPRSLVAEDVGELDLVNAIETVLQSMNGGYRQAAEEIFVFLRILKRWWRQP